MNQELLHPDRLFPIDTKTRGVARELYELVRDLPIISPHGHTDPEWFAENESFSDPVSLLLTPDHYLLRMFYSQGFRMEDFGVHSKDDHKREDKREIWRRFAENFYLFRGTPSALWLKHVFHEVFGLTTPFNKSTSDEYFDLISAKLTLPEYQPRALFDKFKIEVLATTDAPFDSLSPHQKIKDEWGRRVIPTYRPDSVIDPEHENFHKNMQLFAESCGEDVFSWKGYLRAHQTRRSFFKAMGATATDHGHESALTVELSDLKAEELFNKIVHNQFSADEARIFRGHMLWKMAEMSQDDGLVMQLHPGSYRNHNTTLFKNFGRDKGADIPTRMEFTENLRALLNSFGNNRNFKFICFTLDESAYSSELATLAGHYPAMKLGPAWWFHDSPEGMIRHRKATMETAGFYNVTGFIDDTRAFLSIPARHDVSRRIDARILSELVCEHRLGMDEAKELIKDITGTQARKAFNL